MTKPTKFRRPPMLVGNNAGKLPHSPRKLGKWLWPTTAAALVAGTLWGVRHIEEQVEQSAPEIIAKTGLDPSELQFDASYRNVLVTGTLPKNTSARHLEMVLAKYQGTEGESIRKATVSATVPALITPEVTEPDIATPKITKTEPVIIPEPETTQPENVVVSAIADGDKLTLKGMVPTEQHAKVLNDAALHSFSAANIINTLTVTGQPADVATAEQRINDFATILSNFEDDVHEAQIDLDNNIISGNITTTDMDMSRKIKAVVPSSRVNVTIEREVIQVTKTPLPADSIPIVPASELTAVNVKQNTQPINEAITDQRRTDNIALLQNEFTVLAESIREFVVFAPSSDVLRPEANRTLDEIVTAMNAFPDVLIEIAGHTDSQSSATYNQDLSYRRAEAVANYLTTQGVDKSRLRPNGYGESQPIANNDSADGRAKNRRVEFWAF